ncbi:MAG TPA: dTDP-4-dehydrorhamnose reductase [Gemmatimonadales bacterium]|nr:dTDP-4-dehydrorhamnose reductase [Gemmatimonadales bacterium]
MMSRSAGTALITGAAGQVGRELQCTVPADWRVIGCTSEELDITDQQAVQTALEQVAPTVVLNTAAYTSVDTAERQADRARAVNTEGAGILADAAFKAGARMIHLSTDFVFDGAQGRPYGPSDPPNPLNIYGKTKLAGELLVRKHTRGSALIVRTAWVYSRYGHNFVYTMLNLMRTRECVGVVGDQVGTPTWARGLAQALWRAVLRPDLQGVLHWTDAGVASWYDFAVAIQDEALNLRLLERPVPIRCLTSEEHPTPARRPKFSVLDKSTGWAALGGPPPHWKFSLRCMLQELAHA